MVSVSQTDALCGDSFDSLQCTVTMALGSPMTQTVMTASGSSSRQAGQLFSLTGMCGWRNKSCHCLAHPLMASLDCLSISSCPLVVSTNKQLPSQCVIAAPPVGAQGKDKLQRWASAVLATKNHPS